jgi:hypothetical protein
MSTRIFWIAATSLAGPRLSIMLRGSRRFAVAAHILNHFSVPMILSKVEHNDELYVRHLVSESNRMRKSAFDLIPTFPTVKSRVLSYESA